MRVWVDVEAGKEDVEVIWDEIEKRRAASLRGITHVEVRESDRIRMPLGERLAKARRLVVLGDPGSGKTTLTRWISTAYLLRLKKDPYWFNLPDVKTLPDSDYSPIIIRCRDFDQKCLGGVLEDLLQHTLRKNQLTDHEIDTLKVLLIERLKMGTALLILDGLDEINDPVVRACFCQQLEQIHIAFPNAPIIATSRIVGYREMGYRIGRGFEHVTLADLSQDEKDDFARRWCDLIESQERRSEAAEELIHDIHSSDRIERMTGNPMLLTTMALVKRKVGKLPSRRADLYWEAVQVLLHWRSDVDESLDSREAIPQLEYIAYAMCDRGVQQLRRDEVLDLITKMRAEYHNLHEIRNHTPEEFLHHLEARTALLVETGKIRYLGMDMPLYEFRHLTFQEYLAARALVDGHFPGRDIKRNLAEQAAILAGRTAESLFSAVGRKEVAVTESWRETLRLCTAICSDDVVDSVICSILTPLNGETGAIHRARAIMAALCVADEPNVSEETVRGVFQVFSKEVRNEDGSSLASIITGADAVAVEMANTRWHKILKDCLVEEMLHRNGKNRIAPAFLCGTVGAQRELKDNEKLEDWQRNIIVGITDGTEVDVIQIGSTLVKIALARFIGQNISNLLDVLLSRLGESSNMDLVIAAALWNLNRINTRYWWPNSMQIKRVSDYINNSKSDSIAQSYLYQLIGARRISISMEPLLVRLNDPEVIVRNSAARTLGEIGNDRAIDPLIALLGDSESSTRSNAAMALGKIGNDRVTDPLIALLGDSEANVQVSAAEALGKIGNDRATDPLIALLGDSESFVRESAAEALGEIGNDRATDPLIALLGDSESFVRSSAARALGEIGNDRATDPLIALLSDSESFVQHNAAWALAKIDNDSSTKHLITLLDDLEPRMRSGSAKALGWRGNDRAIDPLIALLGDSEAEVRVSTAEALGEIGSDRSIDPLIALLGDSEADVRESAAEALGKIGNDRAIDPLIALLGDSESFVRSSAARALGKIGSDQAIDPIIALLDDSKLYVRSVAVEALGNIGGDYAIEILTSRFNNSENYLQTDIGEALAKMGSDYAIEQFTTRLDDSDGIIRSEAVRVLSSGIDEIDRKLLSHNLDGMYPFLDPSNEVSDKSIKKAADILSIKAEKIKSRYEVLAKRFHLHLSWTNSLDH